MANSNDDSGADIRPEILIVDDDHPTLTMLGQGLREAGYAVRIAASGMEALRHCEEQAPELAMLGTSLPDMPGWDVAADLRQRSIPFIFLSGHNDHEVIRQSIRLGAYSYLYKPLNANMVVPIVNAALQRGAEWRQSKPGNPSASFSAFAARETSVAIGVLMERNRLSAEEAFEALRRYARSQRRKMSDVAAQVVRATEEINISIKSTGSTGRKPPDKSQK